MEQANEAVGDADVCIMGGAETVRQYLEAGLIDEMWIHLVPVLIGDGIRLFESIDSAHIELEPTRVIESPDVTHLWFDIVE